MHHPVPTETKEAEELLPTKSYCPPTAAFGSHSHSRLSRVSVRSRLQEPEIRRLSVERVPFVPSCSPLRRLSPRVLGVCGVLLPKLVV